MSLMTYLYCLQLQNNKYYIANTSQNNISLNRFNIKNSVWTQKYKPLKIIKVIKSDKIEPFLAYYQNKKGINNVYSGYETR